MNYDFKTLANRKNKGSRKWDLMELQGGKITENTVPLTVADMDFLMARPIVDGLKNFIEENALGYFWPTNSYYESIISWYERRNSYKIKKDWIIPIPGVKPGFTAAIRAFSKKDEGVIIFTPTYGPMMDAVLENERKLVSVSLKNINSHFEIDFDKFERECKNPNNKILLLCSPHNPTGRVWNKDELRKISEIALSNNIKIVSDEIWSDFVRKGYKHRPISSISKQVEDISIILSSPSKSFNMAALSVANLIVSNKNMKEEIIKQLHLMKTDSVNGIGLFAAEIAYNQCEDWFENLLIVLEENRKIALNFFENLGFEVSKAEGTYLLWVDFSKLGLCEDRLDDFLKNEAGFYSTRGSNFGKEGNLYRRINIALPSSNFRVQLDMLEESIKKKKY